MVDVKDRIIWNLRAALAQTENEEVAQKIRVALLYIKSPGIIQET